MNPETLKKLMESAEFREFAEFIATECEKLNHLDDFKDIPNVEIPLEVLARRRAFEALKRILDPILNYQKVEKNFNNQDFIT